MGKVTQEIKIPGQAFFIITPSIQLSPEDLSELAIQEIDGSGESEFLNGVG